MKIILINNLYKPYAKGGSERVVEMTALALRVKGHEVIVITASPKRKDYQEEIDGIRVLRVYSSNLIFYGSLARLPIFFRIFWHLFDVFNIRAAWRVQRIVQDEKPDVIFLHNLKGLSYLIPHCLRKYNTVLIPHDTQLAIPSGVILYGREHALEHKNLATKLYQIICRRLFGSIKVIISPSKWLLDFYLQLDFFKKSQKKVLHNPCLISPPLNLRGGWEGLPHNDRYMVSLDGKSKTGVRLLFVGQLEASKGILFLIYTLQSVTIPFHLTIVGDGSQRKNVEELVRNDSRFSYLGKLESDALHKKYTKTDFTVIPSLVYENCPSVIGESFAHVVPIVASRIGGIPELVIHGKNGFLFEPGNSNELLKVLQELPDINLTEFQSNAKLSAEELGIDRYIDQLLVSLRTY